MNKKGFFLGGVILFLFCFTSPMPCVAHSRSVSSFMSDQSLPENTVLLASEMDTRFSQDFSPLLKHLRLEWVILDQPRMTDKLREKNIILIGHPETGAVGEFMQKILTEEEISAIAQSTDPFFLLEKESPWSEERNIYICSGANYLQRRNAAEAMIRQLISDSPPASDWIRATYDYDLGEGFHDYIEDLQYQWIDTEIPLEDLMIDLDAKSPLRVTQEEALEDVDRLFYLLSHGYSGYAFFGQDGEFDTAQANIEQELTKKSTWSKNALSDVIFDNLSFIHDCHLSINNNQFAIHQEFWYDTQLELHPELDGYLFSEKGDSYEVVSINGEYPAPFLFPSLNKAGEPIYRIGVLSIEKPSSLRLIAINEGGEHQFNVTLKKSDFDYYADDVFSEDLMGGIPVIRVRSFGDAYPEELNKFVDTAREHRGEPVVIVDIRGNSGGNETWPISWIQGLTGRRAGAVFATSELESKTTMAGRANAFIYWDDTISNSAFFNSNAKLHTQKAERFEAGLRHPAWTNARYPDFPLISNDTTVVLVTNDLVASAGEGMVLRSSQVENLLVVGENTRGCLTFGNISLHQLPHSKIKVWMPINFCVFSDQEFREGIGLTPDLWVPAKDAVNYTIAAIRKGTITTNQPLSDETLTMKFNPESTWRRMLGMDNSTWLVIGILTVGGAIWAYLLRKKPPVLLTIGGGWIAFSLYWNSHRSEKFIGYGFFLIGAIWLLWGALNLINEYKIRSQQDHSI